MEFLDIKENTNYLETDLEKNILEHLKEFLLELGKFFTYVGNQVRITIDNDYFYPDLVFYNRILKCFVIIDLKIGKVFHKDIRQMRMYVNYYDRKIKSDEENKTIFSTEFRLTIPSEKEFIDVIENEKKNLELV